MEVSSEEPAPNDAVMGEITEKPHNDEEFFEDPTEFEAENEEGFDYRYSPGRGGFR